jgi:hypothetical protein
MEDLMKAGGLTLGLVVAGVLVVGIGLAGCQAQPSSEVEATASPSASKPVSEGAIPALDAEVPSDIATATFAMG